MQLLTCNKAGRRWNHIIRLWRHLFIFWGINSSRKSHILCIFHYALHVVLSIKKERVFKAFDNSNHIFMTRNHLPCPKHSTISFIIQVVCSPMVKTVNTPAVSIVLTRLVIDFMEYVNLVVKVATMDKSVSKVLIHVYGYLSELLTDFCREYILPTCIMNVNVSNFIMFYF